MKPAIGVMALATCFASGAQAQVILNGAGFYDQNFDSLASSGADNPWVDNGTLPGWYADREIGGPLSAYDAGTGTSTTGSLYSFGTDSSDSDRALGSLASGSTGDLAYGVRFQNAPTGSPLEVSISYAGEQWRANGNVSAQSLQFSYRVSNSPITSSDALNPPGSAGWIAFNSLDFTSPLSTAASSALNGHLTENRTKFVAVPLTGVVLNPGEELFIRWFDSNDTGNDHALAIDGLDVAFTVAAVPEPREYGAAAALGLLCWALFRRFAMQSSKLFASCANFPDRGCVRSTSRSAPLIRCGWVFDHSRGPFWLRLRRAVLKRA